MWAVTSATGLLLCLQPLPDAAWPGHELRSAPAVSTLTMGSFYSKASGLPVCFSNTPAFFLKCGQLRLRQKKQEHCNNQSCEHSQALLFRHPGGELLRANWRDSPGLSLSGLQSSQIAHYHADVENQTKTKTRLSLHGSKN